MMRTVQFSALVLLIAGLLFFNFAGGWVRDRLSPQVICELPRYSLLENSIYIAVPESASAADDTGTQVGVWAAVSCDRYPEKSYMARFCPAVPVFASEGLLYFDINAIPADARIIVSRDRELTEEQRVFCRETGTGENS